MQSTTIGEWKIEYALNATREAYTLCKTVKDSCDCFSCKNYFFASQNFPQEINTLFKSLGIDPTKPAEVYDNSAYKDGKVLYGGFYHIVGNILSGKDVWQPVKSNHKTQVNMLTVTDNFEVGFTSSTDLVDKQFPHPVCQMEISFWVPWVIDEPYPSL